MFTFIVIVFIVFFIIAGISMTARSSDPTSVLHQPTSFEPVMHDYNLGTLVEFDIAGLFYREQAAKDRASRLIKDEPLVLEAEPTNPADPYAIQVKTRDGFLIGYVPRFLTEKWHDKIHLLSECHVARTFPDGAVIGIHAMAFFGIVTADTYQYLMTDYKLFQAYSKQFPVLQNLVSKQKQIMKENKKQLQDIVRQYPDDFFMRIQYLNVLCLLEEWNNVEPALEEIKNKFPLAIEAPAFASLSSDLLHKISLSQKKAQDDQISFKQGQAKVFLQDKKYDQALPLLLFCYEHEFQQQKLILDICKCYKQLNDREGLISFCNDALQKDWISPNTAGMLTSYQEK